MAILSTLPDRIRRFPIVLLALVACGSASAFEVIIRIGDPAPQIGTSGYTIESFVEPPSIISGSGPDSSSSSSCGALDQSRLLLYAVGKLDEVVKVSTTCSKAGH